MTEEQTEATPEVQDKPQEPTVEELQKQLDDLRESSSKYEGNWKESQRVTSKKDQEIQRLREQLMTNESQSAMVKALITLMAQRQGQSPSEFEENVKVNQPDLLKQYEEIMKQSEVARERQELEQRALEYRSRVESLGLKPGDDDYDVIQAFVVAGKFDKADKKLAKLEEPKEAKPPEVKPKTEEEIALEYLKRKEILKQEPGKPSAASGSFNQVRDEYIADPNNPAKRQRYLEARRERGL